MAKYEKISGSSDNRAELAKQLLDDELKIEKKNAEELAKYELKLREEIEKKIQLTKKRFEEDLIDKLSDLELKGIKVNQKQKEALLKQQQVQAERQAKRDRAEAKKEIKSAEITSLLSKTNLDGTTKSLMQRTGDSIKAGFIGLGDTFKSSITQLGKDLQKAFGNEVNKAMSTYAQYQTGINARLQASGKSMSKLEKNLSQVAYSPLLKSETLYQNLATLVQDGIVSNVEQRAFLMTIKDNIATTFDANNSSLKRIIRLQQEDSTASRLGMEAYLTRYMNQMVQNTEYLTTSFDNVQSALLEASSLMNMSQSTSFEFQVQKWLGTMTGLGLSESTSSSLAQAIGYLGSGNIEGLTGNNVGNLLLMAANRAGLSVGDLAKSGLQGNVTNTLLASLVNFVQDIWDNSKDNNVVLSQLSNTFGLTVSDVRSIANMSKELENSLVGTSMTNAQMYSELGYQFNQIGNRMSIATLLENAFSNFGFQTGATLASNPATYALWKIADFIGNATSGINIPSGFVMGTGVDLNTTIDNLLKLGLVGYSTLSNIKDIAGAMASLTSGASLLSAMGINQGSSIISRGAELSQVQSGFSVSQSAYMINSNQEAYEAGARMMQEQQTKEAEQNLKQKEKDQADLNKIDNRLEQIIDILDTTGIVIKNISGISGLTLGGEI